MPGPKLYSMQKNPYPFAYTVVRDPDSNRTVYRRIVSPIVPDRIIQTGNRKELRRFYFQNADRLTGADKRYLKSKIYTAEKLEHLERKALKNIAQGKKLPQPEITTKKGYQGINIKLDGPQSSGNGCWSCGMNLILKSRGIDLSQEEIRAFRPDFEPGQEKLTEAQMLMRNRDTGCSPYENADLFLKVMPNTAVQTISFNPVDEEMMLSNEVPMPQGLNQDQQRQWQQNLQRKQNPNPPRNLNEQEKEQWLANWREERRKRAGELYKKKAKELFVAKVKQGLLTDKSPVILNRGGSHFVTITGINEDGSKIRYEESFPNSGSTTKYAKVDDLIDKYLDAGMHGLGLTWVKDLPVADKDKQPEQTEAIPELKQTAAIDKQGNISLQEGEANISVFTEPRENVGQLKGQEITEIRYIDQREIQEELGAQILGFEKDEKGNFQSMIATENTYLPKKIRLLNDKSIEEELKQREKEDEELDVLELQDQPDDRIVKEDDIKEEPAAGTYDAFVANQKQQLYEMGPDLATYISKLYAVNVFQNSNFKRDVDEDADEKAALANAKVDQIAELEKQGGQEQMQQAIKLHQDLTEMYPHMKKYLHKGTDMLMLTPDQMRREIEDGCRTEKAWISPLHQKFIDKLTEQAAPVVKDMLGEEKGGLTLPLIAAKENQRELVEKIDTYAKQKYYIPENPQDAADKPDWIEKKKVIDDAVTALRATGTGKNYFGAARKQNSDAYEQMLSTLEDYNKSLKEGKTPDGMQNRMVIQKCFDYIKDKMPTRSTKETGQVRFDKVMGVLQQVMPEKQFNRLLQQINTKRGVTRGDKDYVDANTYAPSTAKRFTQQWIQHAMNKTGSTFVKLCSEALAAKLIAANSPRGDRTVVFEKGNANLNRALAQKAEELRADPAFQSVMKSMPGCSTQEELNERRQTLANGEGLKTMYEFTKEAGVDLGEIR